ncbi:DUF11 domain-containing protein [Aliivibrio sp. S4TY2]|uniref:DUF11 domain-containing protein n=1 Tax=unclassified Aliivibrio TaxID=2645654 RepID=UPI002377DADA|nr:MULTISPECIES: DUF11 domain-containing protein [unclassified Aliivibrio]MDD9157809.1 DUF11 domain-containing protein [Aliivibrio sp. S4TY2]MDD9161838.1 DUF11 domain-containing protein [Aliivibrio sp. S4TY1]MDD9165868.1 DUF11 domain-containing protein [Aliivibrio sp. S4MY2]MDD9169809.1 DUF11 domain-containing protein [Aliivibrio sp. S4MY4]MDD9186802.1 DUF11 domain-containing protein [Aliivibrio sp. S4MY3]
MFISHLKNSFSTKLFSLFIGLFLSLGAHSADLTIAITADSAIYENNEIVSYQVTVTNVSSFTIDDISVSSEFMSAMSGSELAFQSTEISGSATWFSNKGDFSTSGDLMVSNAKLQQGGVLTYTVLARVSDTAIADVSIQANVTSSSESIDSNTQIITPAPYEYTLTLSVDKSQYELNDLLTYTLKAENTGSYKVQHLAINQLFSSLSVESIDGSLVSPFSSVAISAKKSGTGSHAGVFAPQDDLVVTDASLDVGGSVTYTIKATVVDKLVGDIVTSASSTTKDGVVDSIELTTPPVIGELTITNHEFENTTPYLVNGEMKVHLSVENTGGGIVHNYHVQHNISDLLSTLGNDLDAIKLDQTDVQGNPYNSWVSKVNTIGSNSVSALNDSGELTDTAFDDVVSVYPGETIDYLILATITPVTIGEIKNLSAKVLKSDGSLANSVSQITTPINAEKVLQTADPEIKITKLTSQSQYTPGGEVVYDITVENTSSKYFANNLIVVDKLSCIKTEQAGGEGSASAFKSWKLEVTNGSDNQGTDAGKFTASGTGDVVVSPDVAPGKKVIYKLTATVNDTSIGIIIDNDPSCADDVTEDGTGVEMPDDSLSVTKDVDSYYYSSGQLLTYTIKVTNNGDGFADQVSVVDDLAAIMVTDIYGNSIPAYSYWTVTANAEHIDGTPASATDTGVSGAITHPNILDVKATIEPKTTITYTIKARTIATANSKITNQVIVDGKAIADRGSVPRDFAVTINKAVKIDGAATFSGEQTSYSKPATTVTYQLVLKNDKANGYATNVDVVDPISTIKADLLEPENTQIPVFTTWTIATQKEVIDASGLSSQEEAELLAATDVGIVENNKDLNTTAQIPPNVRIIYTITAQIDRTDDNKIVWGKFNNIATVSTPDNGKSNSDNAWVHPKDPDVLVTKTTPNDVFKVGEIVEFNIYIFNKGAGYANDVDVSDDIIGMDVFEPGWTIQASTEGHPKSGSYTDIKATWPDGGNIQSRVDIDPKESSGDYNGMGHVVYKVIGTVKSDYIKDEISNTAEIHDPATGTDHSSTAEIGKGAVTEKFNISILKTSDKVKVVPGEDITYTISLLNNSATITAKRLTVADLMTQIKSVLANDKDDHFENDVDQSPFDYWQIKLDGEASFGPQNTDDFIYPAVGSSDVLELAPQEVKTFQIKAKVKDNYVGTMMSGSLTNLLPNDAYVYRDFGEVTEQSHISHHENEITWNGADTIRQVLVNGSSNQYYSPGDELTYTIKVLSKTGYLNDHKVTEDILGLDVLLMDGTTENPFSNVFSVDVMKDDANGGRGTTDGTLDGTVEDNKNINTTIDVAGGDYVLYTIKGIVREDAVGDIDIGGITIRPNEFHLTFSKEVDEINYKPGESLTYHLLITNDGKGNAYDIPVLDEISKVQVELVDGNLGSAFMPGWTINPVVTGGSAGGNVQVGTVTDGKNINTRASIPAGATIDYVVATTVNPEAVGDIINILSVNGDRVSAISKPDAQKFDYSKIILAYYDTDGVTKLSSGLSGYKPDGFVEYQIEIINDNEVHLNDIAIIDRIRSITTECYNINTGSIYTCPAFDRWEIITETDRSPISNPGMVKDNENIDTTFDLAAKSSAPLGSFVRYKIKAHIVESAVGEFKNEALIAGRYNVSSDRSVMLPSVIKKTHKAYSDSAFSTVKTTYNHQVDDQKVYYHLRLENNGDGTEYGKSLVEKFSDLKVRLAQTALGQGDNEKGIVYQPNGWSVTATTSGESMTSIGSYVGGVNADIDLAYVSIAPNGWIDFVMESQIRDDSLDAIQIKPLYNGSGFSKSHINSDPSGLEVTKKIVSIAGQPYSSGDTYKPGDSVEYQFVVKNIQPVWRDNTVIQDLLSNIQVEVIGGANESALINTNITDIVTTGLDADIDTKPLDYDPNDDLDIKASDGLDIAPMEEISFTITGDIREDAVGVVDANTAVGGNNTVTTDPIPPVAPLLVFEKTVINTTSDSNTCSFPSTTGSGCQYNPSGQVTYEVMVRNDGEGTANDIVIKDLISALKTSDGIDAFTSSNVHLIEQPDPSRFSISGQYDGSSDLNATFDLMSGDSLKFEISGTVSNNATGSIVNTAQIDGVNSNDVTLAAGTAKIIAMKTSDISTYSPGQPIKYTIQVLNKSDTNSEVTVVDLISSFMVKTADGSMQPALESWTITSRVVSDGDHDSSPSYTDISSLPTSGDINSVIKMAARNADSTMTNVEIVIDGMIRKDAIGQFTNTVTVNGAKYQVDVGYIVPEKGELSVTKNTSKTPATYVPGETIGFDVQVENIGGGYVTNVNISDLSKSIKTDFAGQAREGRVFEQWDVTNVSVVGAEASLSQPIAGSEITGSDGYEVNYNIAPSHIINLHLEGKVNDGAMGDITNIVNVTDAENKIKRAEATYMPEKAALTVTKVVDKSIYEAGDTLTYTIKVTNTTAAWAKDVQISDFVSTIESSTIDGNTITAFDSNSITISGSSLTGHTVIPTVTSGDINGTIEIAPNDVLEITISGKLLPTIHGEVKNTVTVELDGVTQTAEAVSLPIIPVVTLLKEAPVETYIPGESSDFVITVTNGTNGFADDIKLDDIISALTVETIDGIQEQAFSHWILDVEANDSDTVITRTSSTINEDIQVNIDLAPLDTVTFTVSGEVNVKATGVIKNTATMEFNGITVTDDAELKPAAQNVSFIKTVKDGSQEAKYIAGEEAEFHITLVNNAASFAQNIQITDIISDLQVTTILGATEDAFSSWDINYDIQNDKYSTTTIDPLPLGKDINVTVDLAPNATIDFIVKGIVNPNALGDITNTASMDDGSTTPINSTAVLKPEEVVLMVKKIADKAEYTNDDDEITFTLGVTNRGSSDVSGVRLVDEISKLQGANGNPLFTEWTSKIIEFPGGTIIDTQNSIDLDSTQTLKAYEGNAFEIIVVGKIGKGLDDDITNTFKVTTPSGITAEDSVTIHVKKFADNEGELQVTKRALKDSAQVGDVIEYEVIIENHNEAEFKGVKLEDRYPSGFQYLEGSTEITNSGPDGEFDTFDDVFTNQDPSITSVLTFNIGDMLAYGSSGSTIQEKVRVRYLLRVTVGATFGSYVNTAYAMTPAEGMTSGPLEIKSNMSSATVDITPDKLFDTASIIGKVFEDNNGDGYQAEATAFDITITADIPSSVYVVNSTTLEIQGQEEALTEKEVAPINKSIVIDHLFGLSRNRTLPEGNKAVLQFGTTTRDKFDFTVTTEDGTHILFKKDDSVITSHTDEREKGLTGENLNITRNLYKDGSHYLWEIIIENMGLYEDGIPGVRLLTVEGIIIETDQYGRYHVPDQWVLDKKGKQFLVKVDSDSLPTGMTVISENPKVLRITPHALTKFNFSIQSKDEK